MDISLPFSQSCENNKLPILSILKRYLTDKQSVLEIGGGTGQHAVFFAEQFPAINWISSEVPAGVKILNLRLQHADLANLPDAIAIDVCDERWPVDNPDVIFTANTLHIMSADSVIEFFAGVKRHLATTGMLLVYGPFKYGGEFTTPSNANFDLWLKARNPLSGVRDFEWINDLATKAGLTLLEDNSMPANNQLLVWQKSAA